MLSKMNGVKVELAPKTPKENQRLCDHCDGIGWLYEENEKFMEKCPKCYNGLIDTCPRCGNDTRGYCTNQTCWTEREVKTEETIFNGAEKITLDQAKEMGVEMIYHESYAYNNGYFDIDDIEDFISNCIDDEIDVPKYVWATTSMSMTIDAYSVAENACDDLHEDALGSMGGNDIDELQEYLDYWCSKQTGTKTYWQDTRYAIVINDEVGHDKH